MVQQIYEQIQIQISDNGQPTAEIITMQQSQNIDLILGRYRTENIFNIGNYTVLTLRDILTNDKASAKLQPASSQSNILNEAFFYQQMQGHFGFPFLVWAGKINSEQQHIFITQPLGKNLEELQNESPTKNFSLQTVCLLGEQMINILENMHEKHIVHQMVNPKTFRIGVGQKSNKIFIESMLSARRFRRKKKNLKDYNEKKVENISDISPFMSINQISLNYCTPRDDLESMAYTLVYLHRRHLPWLLEFKEKDVAKMKEVMMSCKVQVIDEKLRKYAKECQYSLLNWLNKLGVYPLSMPQITIEQN